MFIADTPKNHVKSVTAESQQTAINDVTEMSAHYSKLANRYNVN